MIDRVKLWVMGGNGGDGVVSFRREKFVPHGGPDGGDGGNGGSVFLVAARGLSTLSHLRYRKRYQAGKGSHGKGKNRHGRRGRDLTVEVPLGTLVTVEENGEQRFLTDLTIEGQRVLVAKGGSGGWGNARFATATNQTPRVAQKGEPGAEHHLVLDLKLIAAVGIIGEPNAGKSTLLSSVSKARPKIADYPFTTTEPILGVVGLGYHAFVLAEIPGLIEGAHRGQGLGHHFLRHIERTKVLIHLLDGSADNLPSHLNGINRELMLFHPDLGQKSQLIAVNKIDLPSVRARIRELKGELEGAGAPLCFISAATGEGLAELMATTVALLQRSQPQVLAEESQFKVFRPKAVK